MAAQDAIPNVVAKPVRSFGGFFSMTLDVFTLMFRPPFAWREYILQSWFVARVSLLPTLMLTVPYTVLLTFTFNILLTEFGAADFSGTGAALGTVTQIGPIVTVLVIAGAGATAMCESSIGSTELDNPALPDTLMVTSRSLSPMAS